MPMESEDTATSPPVSGTVKPEGSGKHNGPTDATDKLASGNSPNLFPAVAATAGPAISTPMSSDASVVADASSEHRINPPSQVGMVDEASERLALLLTQGKIDQSEVIALQKVILENISLKEKVAKLKSLLTRSAKAQREAKTELDFARNRLATANNETQRLNERVDKLEARPTHMDLLADFETNFDKALLTIGSTSGGESSKEGTAIDLELDTDLYGSNSASPDSSNVQSSLLLTEISDAKARIDKLQSHISSLLSRTSTLEKSNKGLAAERDRALSKVSNLQLELRMAKMEGENAARLAREREQSVAEMQLEIDLVIESAMVASVRAAEGMEASKTIQYDREHVKELEAKVTALQEWALASAEAKRVSQERLIHLEGMVRDLKEAAEGNSADHSASGESAASGNERRLWSQSSSLVIGAGLISTKVFKMGDEHLGPNESVILRWKMDLRPSNTDILFSIIKGPFEAIKRPQLKGADAIFRDRVVAGGGAGEATGAFAIKGSCTLVWSNETAWVRPKTVKYTVEAYAVM